MNKQTYLLQNQDKHFLSKNNEWVDGRDVKELFKAPHRDMAMNHLVEVNTHDYLQRIHIIECETKGHNLPIINDDDLPPPIPKSPKQQDLPAMDDNDSADAKATNNVENNEFTATLSVDEEPKVQESENQRNPEGELLVQEV